jgi:hypothetical protein
VRVAVLFISLYFSAAFPTPIAGSFLPPFVLGNFDDHTSNIRGLTVRRILSELSANRK